MYSRLEEIDNLCKELVIWSDWQLYWWRQLKDAESESRRLTCAVAHRDAQKLFEATFDKLANLRR